MLPSQLSSMPLQISAALLLMAAFVSSQSSAPVRPSPSVSIGPSSVVRPSVSGSTLTGERQAHRAGRVDRQTTASTDGDVFIEDPRRAAARRLPLRWVGSHASLWARPIIGSSHDGLPGDLLCRGSLRQGPCLRCQPSTVSGRACVPGGRVRGAPHRSGSDRATGARERSGWPRLG